ncbi:hypothetical protein MMC12_005072 [Toensbergia leucococca]|nr:hypothetical protein [Toensbergia leucococca]
MEPSYKRRRIIGTGDPEAELDGLRMRNDLRLKTAFESIFDKYSKDFSQVGDEIDMNTGEIVVDNGHVLGMTDENDLGDYDDSTETDDDTLSIGDELASLDQNLEEEDMRAHFEGEEHVLGSPESENSCNSEDDADSLMGEIPSEYPIPNGNLTDKHVISAYQSPLDSSYATNLSSQGLVYQGPFDNRSGMNPLNKDEDYPRRLLNRTYQPNQLNHIYPRQEMLEAASINQSHVEPDWRSPPLAGSTSRGKQRPLFMALELDETERERSLSPPGSSVWAIPRRGRKRHSQLPDMRSIISAKNFEKDNTDVELIQKKRLDQFHRQQDHSPAYSANTKRRRHYSPLRRKFKQGNHLIKMHSLQSRPAELRGGNPWTKKEERLLHHLTSTTNLTFAGLELYFPGRSLNGIQKKYWRSGYAKPMMRKQTLEAQAPSQLITNEKKQPEYLAYVSVSNDIQTPDTSHRRTMSEINGSSHGLQRSNESTNGKSGSSLEDRDRGSHILPSDLSISDKRLVKHTQSQPDSIKRARPLYTAQEDARLLEMRARHLLPWSTISESFKTRTIAGLQTRYSYLQGIKPKKYSGDKVLPGCDSTYRLETSNVESQGMPSTSEDPERGHNKPRNTKNSLSTADMCSPVDQHVGRHIQHTTNLVLEQEDVIFDDVSAKPLTPPKEKKLVGMLPSVEDNALTSMTGLNPPLESLPILEPVVAQQCQHATKFLLKEPKIAVPRLFTPPIVSDDPAEPTKDIVLGLSKVSKKVMEMPLPIPIKSSDSIAGSPKEPKPQEIMESTVESISKKKPKEHLKRRHARKLRFGRNATRPKKRLPPTTPSQEKRETKSAGSSPVGSFSFLMEDYSDDELSLPVTASTPLKVSTPRTSSKASRKCGSTGYRCQRSVCLRCN